MSCRRRRAWRIALLIIAAAFSFGHGQIEAQQTSRPAAGSLTFAVDSEPRSFDLIAATVPDGYTERLQGLLYDSLLGRNARLEIVGRLAKSFSFSNNGKTLEFVLREGVKFHDGSLLTAEDVKFTFESLISLNGYKATPFFTSAPAPGKPLVVSIKIKGPGEISFELANPRVVNSVLSALTAIPIIKRGEADNSGNGQQKSWSVTPPIGTGPYRFVKFDSANKLLELASNETYWDGPPEIKTIYIRSIADKKRLADELQAEIIDIVLPGRLLPREIKELADDPTLNVKISAGTDIKLITFNTTKSPVNNVKVRQAIAYAINRQAIIRGILEDQAMPADSVLPANSWAYAEDTRYNYDPAKSKSLLREAGYRDRNHDGILEMPALTFKIPGGDPVTAQYSLVIAASLRKIGLPVVIEPLERSTLIDQLRHGSFQMTVGTWIVGNRDPEFLGDIYGSSEIPSESKPGRNRSRYRNTRIDKLTAAASLETDQEKARLLYAEVQKIVSRDVPLIPLWYPAAVVIANKKVGNIKLTGSEDWSFIKSLTLAERVE
jgi:peptide/nickel transport system substrate-binding protein